MNDRQAVELRKIERMRNAFQDHAEWVKVLQAPFLAGIRALNKEMHTGLTEAQKSFDEVRQQIEQDYSAELREIDRREHDTTR